MEALLRAEMSSDLSEVRDSIGDVDFLRASGMVAQHHPLAFAVWRLADLGEGRAAREAFDLMAAWLICHGYTSNPIHIASEVLTWLARPVCDTCHGRQYDTVPGTPALSGHVCHACGGSGKKPQPWGPGAIGVYEYVLSEQRLARAAIIRKLRAA